MKITKLFLCLISPCKKCLNVTSCWFCSHKNWRKYRTKKTLEIIKEKYEVDNVSELFKE